MLRIVRIGYAACMADSAAVRNRRARAHKRGEHGFCGPRCAVVAANGSAETAGTVRDETVTVALYGVLAGLVGQLGPDDPKQLIAAVARTAARRIDDGAPMHGTASLLLEMVKDLSQEPGRPGDRFDMVLAGRHQRRLESALAQAERRAQS